MCATQSTVYYCSVSRDNRVLYSYSGDDHEIDNLAALCLERVPAFHKWYFETTAKKTFGFLMEDGHVYFTIVDEGIGNAGLLRFLKHMRDEFRKVARKGSRGSLSTINSMSIQEHLVPVIRSLITSLENLENVSHSTNDWTAETASSPNDALSPSPSNVNGQIEVVSSTKAPLLRKSSKQEKKKGKDHVITMRDIELDEHRKSTDRGLKVDSMPIESSNQGGSGSSSSLQKDLGSMRIRSGSQSIRKKWWRQVRIVLAIDAAVCVILFVIWLLICRGVSCLR